MSEVNNKKLRTKDLIYAGAFGALYIVLMLILVMSSGMVPILYILAPITVGVFCGTVYELCVLKVRKFGPALIMGLLFALVACNGAWYCFVTATACALLAELIIFLGKYKSKFMYLLSFVVFNINMSCPYMIMTFNRDGFMTRARDYYGEEYANGLSKLMTPWIWYALVGFAIIGGILGALIASKLIKKHFTKAGIV
ncbi:MAG: MptD family putative ECF transporter S component [Lachnospiraceae bacterium]|nr:MptD family putative ECF transporter S component [Lachnospiraceae bacterium]